MSSTDSNTEVLVGEPNLLLSYLYPKKVSPEWIEKYQNAVRILNLPLNDQELSILRFAIQHPNLISFIDGGLSLFKPQSNLKKRFVVATSIVESAPQSFDLFLNSDAIKFPKWRLFQLGIQTVFTLSMAYLLFNLKKWK